MSNTEATLADELKVVTGVTPYINVPDARAAAEFYKRAFGAIEIAAMPVPDGRLIHCHLSINGGPLMLNDPFPENGAPYLPPQAFMLHLQVNDIESWWTRAVDAGCDVLHQLRTEFWGDRYGQIRDPFGITWSLGSAGEKQ